ncbi:NBR1-Ig-like domain-containing protein [Streptosporangium sp. KLBMP 9127]|nr:hypothetical protein [Streptosporangium sp. KLBMP 9127]
MRDSASHDDERQQDLISGFAAELRSLRAAAGNPSFRRMAGRSRRISHTTLHEAAAGSRFPSWATTQEFVRACGGDEGQWRSRWERVRDATDRKQAPEVWPAVPAADPGPGAPGRRRVIVLGALAIGAAGALVAGFLVLGRQPPPGTASPPSGPLISGDRSRFVTDVTIPDGTLVKVNETFVKVWEIQNSGTIFWRNRYLERDDKPVLPGGCRTVERIPIGDTLPNERVKISVTVTAPSTPGTCVVKWKMVDVNGRILFPTSRPVFFLVHVVDEGETPSGKDAADPLSR